MSESTFQPGHVIVTSAMRTGSTWLVKLLRQISETRELYVTSVEDAVNLVASTPGGIIKTHGIIDIDWNTVPAGVPIVRIVRNYKDSLLSRALYVKNIRPSAGEPITEPAMRELLAKLGDVTDKEFISAFVDDCSLVHLWLAEIAVMERSTDDCCFTLMYESMMKNPYDVMAELVDALWPGWKEGLARVSDVVRASIREGFRQRETFLRKLAVGVGGWETLLTVDQSERLDDLFFKIRKRAFEMPASRWPDVIKSVKTS